MTAPRHPARGNGQSGMGNRGNGEVDSLVLMKWGRRRTGADCLPDSPFPIPDSQGRGGGAE